MKRKRVIEVAKFLISERGYVVIGSFYRLRVGEITECLWSVETGQPFQVIKATDVKDAWQQGTMVRDKFGADWLLASGFARKHKSINEFPKQDYFRAVTE